VLNANKLTSKIIEMKKQKNHKEKSKETREKTTSQLFKEIVGTEKILEAVGDGITIIDKAYKIIFENEVHRKLFGDNVGKQCYKMYQKRQGICGGCPVALTFKDAKVHTVEREIHTEKGTKYVEITASPLKDSKGNIIAGIEVVRDITERKKVEEKLQFERKQLFSIFDSIDEIVYVTDPVTNRILYTNPFIEKAFGKKLIGELCYEVLQNKHAPCDFCTNEIILKNKGQPYKWEFHNPLINKDLFIIDRIIKWADGRDVRLEFAFDITEQKKSEEKILRSETLLRETQNIAHLGSWELDLTNNYLFWSEEVYRIFGLQAKEFAATYEAFLECVHPDDRAAVDTAYSDSLREGRDTYEIEHRVVKRDTGEIRYVHEKCIHQKNKDNQIIRSIGMVHDITERKQAEEAIIQREKELHDKTQSLEELNTALKVLLEKRQEDKVQAEEKIMINIRELVKPYLEKLKNEGLNKSQKTYMDIIESNLDEVVSSFTVRLSSSHLNLTPTEIQVANLIKQGKRSKEIAELIHISPKSVAFHRGNIRKKLGLQNKKTNLRSYLLSTISTS
jgi:PAS domain S-box-containing protein